MKNVTVKIKHLFEVISELYDEFTYNEPKEIKHDIMVQTQDSEWVECSHLIKKEDKIREIEFESGIKSKTALDHLYFNGEKCINASLLKINDEIKSIHGFEKIVKINDFNKEDVYDLTIQTPEHLYLTANGLIHHNTSFIRSLSTLTGIPLVVIEAPHITQEHLINIPFLVLDGPKERKGNLTVDDSASKMKVVQAESNLVTQLKSKTKRTPEQIQREINKNKTLRELYPKVKFGIDKVKNAYNSILFLDEFYRTSSIKIRNVLRNILNGKIGNDKIPKGVYIVMATNIDDEGVEEIPLNQDFHLMDYDVSSKEDFMNYMYGKYVNNPEDPNYVEPEKDENEEVAIGTETGISIKTEVWNKFMDELTDELLGYNDPDIDVRLSPRRLEQMMIYIDAALPIQSVKDAQNLLAFVKTNLSNYMEEEASDKLFNLFEGLTLDLIEETNTNNVSIDKNKLQVTSYNKTEWRDQLQHEIEMKMRLGENRKYIPVVSGLPGIGKTSQMIAMAKEMGMGFIQVDVSNLTPEDITGMPIADMSGDNITTEFSEPNLYITIMQDYNDQIEDVRQEGRKYNVILLFDEMNRSSVPVFNAIRKVLLEKSFEHVKLPDDIIVTGAINPHDIGSIEFTSHTRDVIDIIPSGGHFQNTINYIAGKKQLIAITERLGFDIHNSILNIMSQLAMEFKSTVDNEDNPVDDIDLQPFWWTDGGAVFYVSPREMTECVANACKQVENALGYMGYDVEGNYSDEDIDEFIEECIGITADSFVDTFNMITLKQDIEGFSSLLGKKILGNEKFKKMFEGIRTKKSANIMNLVQLLRSADGDINYFSKKIIGEYVKDFSSSEMIQDINDIVNEYFKELNGDSDIAVQVAENILDLHNKLFKSLNKLDVSNNYVDQLNKCIGGRIAALMSSDDSDIFKFIENDKILKRIENLI